MDCYIVSLAKVAIGEQELKSISTLLYLNFIDLGLLEPDGSWNPFVWMYFALLGRGIVDLGEKDIDFQEWVEYHMTLCNC